MFPPIFMGLFMVQVPGIEPVRAAQALWLVPGGAPPGAEDVERCRRQRGESRWGHHLRLTATYGWLFSFPQRML